MHFLRYQEFYESPRFRKKSFTIVEYMEWYAKRQQSRSFSYPADWSGFNVPSWALIDQDIEDFNIYDENMEAIVETIQLEEENPFYVIGIKEGDNKTLDHEIAHALYYTQPAYRRQMKKLFKTLPKGRLDKIRTTIGLMGYHRATRTDEAQAYLSTGPSQELKRWMPEKMRAPFIKIFKEWQDGFPSGSTQLY